MRKVEPMLPVYIAISIRKLLNHHPSEKAKYTARYIYENHANLVYFYYDNNKK